MTASKRFVGRSASKRFTRLAVQGLLLSVFLPVIARGQDRVSETVHNLSASGPGTLRAMSEAQVCIFCHAPHLTNGVQPLWNRASPVTTYQIYQSSTLDANPDQPTGSSKLCLSCHDGTIALGSVLSRSEQIQMVGSDRIPAGLANLGTNLSDDHPVSFIYSSGLAAADRQLINPSLLSGNVKLDTQQRMQCTACHDPHRNTFGDFLVMDRRFGALCTTCHDMDGWSAGSHETSNANVTGSIGGDWPFGTVAANACRSCHRAHSAGGPQRLLIHQAEEDNCLACHDGTVAQTDITTQLNKNSAHDPRRYTNAHDPVETPGVSQPHVECYDCHNPHAVRANPPGGATDPLGNTLLYVSGITVGGSVVDSAQNEYEVCFKCHSDSPVPTNQRTSRQSQEPNMRLKLSPTNPSFHPIVTTSPSLDTISLVPGLTQGSMIRCTDCHNNDSGPRAGGSGPDGPHGSIHESLLERNYTVRDDTTESQFEYDLCYKCHQRTSILSDQSFPLHRKHIVEERSPCSACHDPHGINPTRDIESDHTHLINFDTRIVRPDRRDGRMVFTDLGRFAGSCTLECHGEDHRNKSY